MSNNMGVDGFGLGVLLETGQVRKVISSYVGREQAIRAQYPGRASSRSSSTRRARSPSGCAPAAPASPRSSPRTGFGTVVAEGKERASSTGTYVMERGIVADVSLVKA